MGEMGAFGTFLSPALAVRANEPIGLWIPGNWPVHTGSSLWWQQTDLVGCKPTRFGCLQRRIAVGTCDLRVAGPDLS